MELHWTPKTGLFRSFPDSSDLKLTQQASTYEQAALGLLCIRFGDWDRAEQLFHFFKNAWDAGPDHAGPRHGVRGLVNFYNADFGSEGIEKRSMSARTPGPDSLPRSSPTPRKNAEALQWALDVEYWIANVVPHSKGGVAMGVRDDPFGAPWSRIYSTENNLSYYAFLTELLRSHAGMEKSIRAAITLERDRVENWLLQVAYDPAKGRMLRGINPQGVDRMQALDTTTWLISAIGPKRLAARGLDPEKLMQDAEKTFEVSVGEHAGVDPTDQTEADQTSADLRSPAGQINRPDDDRHRVIWYEGLGQYILAWSRLGGFCAADTGDTAKASLYMQKAEALTQRI